MSLSIFTRDCYSEIWLQQIIGLHFSEMIHGHSQTQRTVLPLKALSLEKPGSGDKVASQRPDVMRQVPIWITATFPDSPLHSSTLNPKQLHHFPHHVHLLPSIHAPSLTFTLSLPTGWNRLRQCLPCPIISRLLQNSTWAWALLGSLISMLAWIPF